MWIQYPNWSTINSAEFWKSWASISNRVKMNQVVIIIIITIFIIIIIIIIFYFYSVTQASQLQITFVIVRFVIVA